MKNQGLQRLIATARKAYSPDSRPPEPAPFGFAGRVAARWSQSPRGATGVDLLERVAWWFAGASAAICLAAFLHDRSLPEPNAFDVFLEADAGDARTF